MVRAGITAARRPWPGIFHRTLNGKQVPVRIAISGAGVAGPTLAHWLLKGGHEVTLIEIAPALRTGGYVIDFWGHGYTIAERMGILPSVLEAGYQLEAVKLVNHRGSVVGGFRADVFRRMTDGRFTSLPRGDLAEIIYHSIEKKAETIFGDSIAALEQHDAGVRVSLEHGGEREFELVIGADGLHSRVRELAFGPQERFEHQLGYHVAAFEVEGYRPRDGLAYIAHADPGRQVARFALRGDVTMFLIVFTSDQLGGPEPHDRASRQSTLRRVLGGMGWEVPRILDAMDDAGEIYFDRVSQIRMPRWSDGRVMLLGDAASCVSLLAGEGTGLGMTEAYVLAGELARADGDHQAAFAAHEERLRPFIEAKQASAAKFAGAFAPRTAFGVWFRNQVTRLMKIPMVANLAAGDLRDELELPEY